MIVRPSGVFTAQTCCGVISCFKNDEAYVSCLKRGELHEQNVLRELEPYIRNANVIVDIGAHVGMHTCSYACMNPLATIYSFEPQSPQFSLLRENVERNSYAARVRLNLLAVGHRTQCVKMCPFATGDNTFQRIEFGTEKLFNLGGVSVGKGGETAFMVRLDDMGIHGCDFMKIDVEGFEPMVVAGAMNLIRTHRPVICYDNGRKGITPTMREGFPADNLDDYPSVEQVLAPLQYSFQVVEGNILATPNPFAGVA